MERGITNMSQNKVVCLNARRVNPEKSNDSLSYLINKIRKTIDANDIYNQIIKISLIIKDLNFGNNPYKKIIEAYRGSPILKAQFDLLLAKIPTVVAIELMDILEITWPEDADIVRRLKLLFIKSLESGKTFKQIEQAFFDEKGLCAYLLEGSKIFEDIILGNNVLQFNLCRKN
jgi:hypothetical protein